MGEDLEATQFPLTAGVFLESIYRSPPPLVVSCRGNRTRSFSLSHRMSHSLPVYTRRHARATARRARAHARATARLRSRLEFSTLLRAAEKYSRAPLQLFGAADYSNGSRRTCRRPFNFQRSDRCANISCGSAGTINVTMLSSKYRLRTK